MAHLSPEPTRSANLITPSAIVNWSIPSRIQCSSIPSRIPGAKAEGKIWEVTSGCPYTIDLIT